MRCAVEHKNIASTTLFLLSGLRRLRTDRPIIILLCRRSVLIIFQNQLPSQHYKYTSVLRAFTVRVRRIPRFPSAPKAVSSPCPRQPRSRSRSVVGLARLTALRSRGVHEHGGRRRVAGCAGDIPECFPTTPLRARPPRQSRRSGPTRVYRVPRTRPDGRAETGATVVRKPPPHHRPARPDDRNAAPPLARPSTAIARYRTDRPTLSLPRPARARTSS
ncbi:unnamed protein product [Aphis gossypii]|uniref:Uncharacterized protein n=1 Tax=Aphis gossypii TaxID=80765 RepID=A0A9P0NPH5_APHGO|nr:unnamed protein product [Aphis gossypii]